METIDSDESSWWRCMHNLPFYGYGHVFQEHAIGCTPCHAWGELEYLN